MGYSDKDFEHIGGILRKILYKNPHRPYNQLENIRKIWPHVISPEIVSNTKPAGLKGARLFVNVNSSAWLQHLGFLKTEMIEQLNEELDNFVITDIKFKIGPI